MNKVKTAILSLAVIAVFAGCGMFSPNPQLSSVAADATQVEVGESVTLTIKGSLKDPNVEASMVDYSGTIAITSSPAGVDTEIAVEAYLADGFTKTKAVSFSAPGVYTLKIELSSADGSKAEKTVSVTVVDPKPWDGAYVTDIVNENSWKNGSTFTSSFQEKWYRFRVYVGSYYVHWQDSADHFDNTSTSGLCDVKVSVYKQNGDPIIENQDHGCYDSSFSEYGSYDGIRVASEHYSSGEWIYMKVEPYYNNGTGTYYYFVF